jgi:hypothetical protein
LQSADEWSCTTRQPSGRFRKSTDVIPLAGLSFAVDSALNARRSDTAGPAPRLIE